MCAQLTFLEEEICRHECSAASGRLVSVTSCLVLRFNSESNANCYYCDVKRIFADILETMVFSYRKNVSGERNMAEGQRRI